MKHFNKSKHKGYHKVKSSNRRLKGITVQLYPGSQEKLYASRVTGCCRFIWNYCLRIIINEYEQKIKEVELYNELLPEEILEDVKDTYRYYDLSSTKLYGYISKLKKTKGYEWLNEINSKAVQQVINNLIATFYKFFAGDCGFPNFKSKKSPDDSTCRFISQAIIGGQTEEGIHCINGNRLTINKQFKNVLFRCSSKDEKYLNRNQTLIHNITLTKTKTYEYYASITIEDTQNHKLKNTNNHVGIDRGIKTLMVCSDGTEYENKHFRKNQERKIKLLNRSLNRKVHGSKNYERVRVQLAKLYKKISRQTKDYIDKATTEIVRNNDIVSIETLNVKGMMKNHHLAKSVQECSFYLIEQKLREKCEKHGRTLVKIDQWFASSKICSECGYKKKDLTLNDRFWTCPECGTTHDRDLNAAVMIDKEGMRVYNESVSNEKDS